MISQYNPIICVPNYNLDEMDGFIKHDDSLTLEQKRIAQYAYDTVMLGEGAYLAKCLIDKFDWYLDNGHALTAKRRERFEQLLLEANQALQEMVAAVRAH